MTQPASIPSNNALMHFYYIFSFSMLLLLLLLNSRHRGAYACSIIKINMWSPLAQPASVQHHHPAQKFEQTAKPSVYI